MHFGEGTKLYAYDYNGDGTNEIVIGQQVEVSVISGISNWHDAGSLPDVS